MDKHYVFKTDTVVCADEIRFDYIDGYIWNVEIVGGCDGNSHAVMQLCEGMKAEEVIKRTRGITCHGGNSCPNELAKAVAECLEEVVEEEKASK